MLEALTICVVEVPGEPIHHALCGMQNAQHTRRTAALREVVDHLLTNRYRAGWKLDPIRIEGMRPVALLAGEPERLHGAIDAPGETGRDEVDVIGFVLVLGIDRHRGTTGEHDRDFVRVESGTDESGDFFERRLLRDSGGRLPRRGHCGLPVRRGRRRWEK